MGWQPIEINGVKMEIRDRGSGEPIVFVHGSMGDELAAVLTEPALADHYRLVDYHRRGYGGSECPRCQSASNNSPRTAWRLCGIWASNGRILPANPTAGRSSCRSRGMPRRLYTRWPCWSRPCPR